VGLDYDGDDKPHATIGYEADLTFEDDAWLRLQYQRNGEPVDYRSGSLPRRRTMAGADGGLFAPSCAVTADRRAAWRSSIFRPVASISGAARLRADLYFMPGERKKYKLFASLGGI